MHTALVLGGGAFGTSMACVLKNKFKKVIIKVRAQDIYDNLLKGENQVYLPGKKLPKGILPAQSFKEVDELVEKQIDLVVWGLPTSAIRHYCRENKAELEKLLKKGIPFVSLSKGIDPDTLELVDDLFFEFFRPYQDLFCFLSGPSFAEEIVDKQITLVSIAGKSNKVLDQVSHMFHTDYFMVFKTYDVKGLLLGGALKNILAIAGGLVEGLGYNHNTRAAMITRGIAEMLRFGLVFNARPETFYGLSGMGDLILTTTSDLSRNKTFGMQIAKGRKASEVIASKRSVVEGYITTKAAYQLAEKYGINCRIFKGVHQVLFEDADPQEVITQIMRVPPRFEVDT